MQNPLQAVTHAVAQHKTKAPNYDMYRDYENGDHQHPYGSKLFRKKYAWIINSARLNMCRRVRTNYSDLVRIQEWRGTNPETAQTIADTSRFSKTLALTIAEAVRTGDAYLLVWPDATGTPVPWFHRAEQFYTLPDPEHPGQLLAAVKLWADTAGYGRANVYTANSCHRYITGTKIRQNPNSAADWGLDETLFWAPYDGDGEPDTLTHTFGQVPVIHIAFDPQYDGGPGRSILTDVIPLQDALNHAVHALIVETEDYAHQLRVVTGYQPEVRLNPNTGDMETTPIRMDANSNRVYAFAGEHVRVSQLDPPDPAGLINLKRELQANIAQVAGIPVSDIAPELGNIPSGAALRTLAATRTNAVRDFTTSITDDISRLMELLGAPGVYPVWVDPAPADEAERTETAKTLVEMGVPLQEVLTSLAGYSADDVDRIMGIINTSDLTLAAAGRQLLTEREVIYGKQGATTS